LRPSDVERGFVDGADEDVGERVNRLARAQLDEIDDATTFISIDRPDTVADAFLKVIAESHHTR
jgi:hypothetical protein